MTMKTHMDTTIRNLEQGIGAWDSELGSYGVYSHGLEHGIGARGSKLDPTVIWFNGAPYGHYYLGSGSGVVCGSK